MKFHTEILSLIVKPEGEPTFSETATQIRIEDEAAGAFIVVEQTAPDYTKIAISPEEWPYIKKAIEDLLQICPRMEVKEN